MRELQIRFNFKNCKKVTSKLKLTLSVAALLFLLLLCALLNKPSLANTSEEEIIIDSAILRRVALRGRTTELILFSGEKKYYIRYPSADYLNYKSAIENELLSETNIIVYGKVLNPQTLQDKIAGKLRLVDLRNNFSVYYDISSENNALWREYTALAVFSFLYSFILFLSTVFVSLNYKIVTLKR